MEVLLDDLVQTVVNESRELHMPLSVNIDEVDAYEKYGLATQINPKKVCHILGDTILLDNLLTRVADIVRVNGWGVYVIEKGSLLDLGDFRIIEWERDHLNERGRYVS